MERGDISVQLHFGFSGGIHRSCQVKCEAPVRRIESDSDGDDDDDDDG